jgi:hypothetical protein
MPFRFTLEIKTSSRRKQGKSVAKTTQADKVQDAGVLPGTLSEFQVPGS